MGFADNLKKLDAQRLQQSVKATVQFNGRLSFTIEAGKGTNPLPISDLSEIYAKTEGIFVSALMRDGST